MLTPRGWWLLLLAVAQVTLGSFRAASGDTLLLIFGLAVLLWVSFEGVLFAVRARIVLRAVTAERQFRDGRRGVTSIAAGRPLEVQLRLRLDHPIRLPHVQIEDRLPSGSGEIIGETKHVGLLSREQPVELRYRLRPPLPGELSFEGVRLTLGDAQGFFTATLMLRDRQTVPILPPLLDIDGGTGTSRRIAILPPPGVHRLRKAGSGGELLDLRDYRPGDPPKQIAWKASARRDRLVTKEYESEVPVRSILFLDTSQSVRVGETLGRLVSLASVIAQSAASDRDIVGLTTFDDQTSSTLVPARGSRHLVDLLRRLAEAARLRPTITAAPAKRVAPYAQSLAQELYPDLMLPAHNRLPFLASWRPLLDSPLAGPVLAILFVPLMVLGFLWATVGDELTRTELESSEWQWLLIGLISVPVAGLLFWIGYGLVGYLPWVRKWLGDRKRLSAVIAWREQTGPAGIARLVCDDRAYADSCQRFLADHAADGPMILTDELGRDLTASPEKLTVLAQALTQAIGRARDNEVYVILADLLEHEDDLTPLLAAVKVALARHHQVLVVCPWLPGMPPADVAPTEKDVRSAAIRRYHDGYAAVRKAFGKLGVRLLAVSAELPERAVVDRLDRLRAMSSLGRR